MLRRSVLAAIGRAGLVMRGVFALAEEERRGVLAPIRTIVLVGFVGRRGWDAFAASPEGADGLAHPLDRWSRRVVVGLAEEFGALALFPFEGPPHWPFQRWAQRAGPARPSPIGLLIHPEYGLWHSYRGALGFTEPPGALAFAEPQPAAPPAPCAACEGRFCLHACPVGAYQEGRFEIDVCAAHLKSPAGAPCMEGGCLARRACPVAPSHAHRPDQAASGMRAFLRARGGAV